MTNLTSPILDKFNITETPVVEFTIEQFKDGYITIPLPRKLRYQMAKYRLENGLNDIPEIKVKSPTGGVLIFTNPTSFHGGYQYVYVDSKANLNIKLRLIN